MMTETVGGIAALFFAAVIMAAGEKQGKPRRDKQCRVRHDVGRISPKIAQRRRNSQQLMEPRMKRRILPATVLAIAALLIFQTPALRAAAAADIPKPAPLIQDG